MPRIDPIQLLNCLSVLLSPDGGIKSRDEVQRIVSLMSKFSKKLVSKCIYIQILKCTETELLGLFMGSGGWLLVHTWLKESKDAKNWPLVKELLELLLLCPVDIERLKTNNCPKLVKELSKDEDHFAIRALASKLVVQWLKTVKGQEVVPVKISDLPSIISDAQELENVLNPESVLTDANSQNKEKSSNNIDTSICNEDRLKTDKSSDDSNKNSDKKAEIKDESEAVPVLKISLKDGKQVVSQIDDDNESKVSETSDSEKPKEKTKNRSKDKTEDKNSSTSSSKSSSSSKHSSKSLSSSDRHKSSSSRHSSSSKDKSRDKDKHSSQSSKSKSDSRRSSSSSSRSKSKDDRSSKSSDKDKSSDRDKKREEKGDKNKDTSLNKSVNEKSADDKPSVHKLGKIPKLSDVKKEKPSISIEVRKPDEPKPKTVKTFNSKFRKHGLEEEVKPPPSRAAVLTKKVNTPVVPPTVSIPKRPSPVHNETPPEKKLKTIEPVDKPGAIKLIPPKPKPMMLLESDMFMDALNASATNKKDPKKRKRRTSGSRDGTSDGSPPHTPTSITSPTSESKSVPPRFYQDTLEAEDGKENSSEKKSEEIDETNVVEKDIEEKMDTTEPHTLTVNGLKGVLCYHKRKGPKKSIKWKPDPELEEIQYFELDETERVNVTKTFTDMKYLERIHERDAFQKGRNISNDDIMEEKTSWRPLILIDAEGQIQVDHGKNSKEKDIQAIRQKGTLQPLYFSKAMIPDSALEPDPETHPYSEPTIIPLEDVTGNQDNVSDFRNMPWPEPKGNAPPPASNVSVPNIFPANMNQFPNNFPNPQFPGVPPFPGNMVPNDWTNGGPPHMVPNGMPGPMAPGAIPPGNLPPGMMMPPENMMMAPEMFGAPNPMFPVPPEGFNMPQNMFPMDYNMSGPPGPDNFSGPNNFRGAMRGRGGNGGWRGKNAGNWEGPQRGRGGSRGGRKAVCIYFQRKGSCRQGDNCSFLHPGVNCPF